MHAQKEELIRENNQLRIESGRAIKCFSCRQTVEQPVYVERIDQFLCEGCYRDYIDHLKE